MTWRERLAMGGALAPVIPLRAAAFVGPGAAGPREEAPGRVDHPVTLATGPTSGELHAELSAEVGDAAEALPLDLVDVVVPARPRSLGRGPSRIRGDCTVGGPTFTEAREKARTSSWPTRQH